MVIIIDHSDMFTYNLSQYYKQAAEDVRVYKSDDITVKEIEELDPDLIVFSSGSGKPEKIEKSRVILEAFHKTIPIFGVGLGFQLIAEFFGGEIAEGKQPMTGKVTQINHDGSGIFQSIPSPVSVTRYDSFVALPSSIQGGLIVSAADDDGTVMAVRHESYAIEGVQFYPDSILTEHGLKMIQNNYEQALAWKEMR